MLSASSTSAAAAADTPKEEDTPTPQPQQQPQPQPQPQQPEEEPTTMNIGPGPTSSSLNVSARTPPPRATDQRQAHGVGAATTTGEGMTRLLRDFRQSIQSIQLQRTNGGSGSGRGSISSGGQGSIATPAEVTRYYATAGDDDLGKKPSAAAAAARGNDPRVFEDAAASAAASAAAMMLEPLPATPHHHGNIDNGNPFSNSASGFDPQVTSSLLQYLQKPENDLLDGGFGVDDDRHLFGALSANDLLSHHHHHQQQQHGGGGTMGMGMGMANDMMGVATHQQQRGVMERGQSGETFNLAVAAAVNGNLLTQLHRATMSSSSAASGAAVLPPGAVPTLPAMQDCSSSAQQLAGQTVQMQGQLQQLQHEGEGQQQGQLNQQRYPPVRFKPFHEEKWSQRLDELRSFRRNNGHCLVPHTYPLNPQLARWVKRQRRQYKLLTQGKVSTLTRERVILLEDIGFVWDSHVASWTEKIGELRLYRARHGNTLVPSGYKPNPGLAVWVKCQRRQYKLRTEGKPSSMTDERIRELEGEGFRWEVRPPLPAQMQKQAREQVAAAAAAAMLRRQEQQRTAGSPSSSSASSSSPRVFGSTAA